MKKALSTYKRIPSRNFTNHRYLSIVDFTLPSNQDRYFLYDLKRHKAIFSTLVSHGKGSGRGAYATKFSNRNGTRMSSLGMYVTTGSFWSKHGRSIHVKGLEPTNSIANRRTVEFHSAHYVSYSFAKNNGRVGNSYGCFALSKKAIAHIRPYVEKGSAVYAYHNKF